MSEYKKQGSIDDENFLYLADKIDGGNDSINTIGEEIYTKLQNIKDSIDGLNISEEIVKDIKEKLTEIDDDIEQLNSDLTQESTGTITSDFTLSQNRCYRKGNVVNIRLYCTGISATGTSTVLASLPEGFRPSGNVYLIGANYRNSEWTFAQFQIASSGNVSQLQTSNEITGFMLLGSFPV